MNNLIEIRNVTKKFGDKVANENISFDIKRGDKIGIIGSNGAGKTTFVEQLIGTSSPTEGEIKYNFDYKKTPQEKMGMQFQDSSYPTGLTVKDVIEFSLSIYGSMIDIKELNHMIKIFKMEDFINAKAKSLSGGQQQKLNVLLAIAHKPELVILDEISTGLDIAAKTEILNFVEKYIEDKNITSILISHNMSEITSLCKRVVVFKEGRVFHDGKIKDIIKKHKSLELYIQNVIEGVNHD